MKALEDIPVGAWGYVESKGERYLMKNIGTADVVAGQEVDPNDFEIPERWQ